MLFLYLAIGIGFLLGAAVITYLAVRDYINGKKNKKLQQKQEEMQHTTQIYQKTMRSTMRIFREVCYVDLEKNKYVLVYPESTNRVRKGNYEEGLAALFRTGVLSEDDTEQVQQLLSVAHIREALADREYIEIRCRYQDKNGEMEECVVSITVADRKRGRVGSVTLAIRSIEDILRKEEAQRELLELSAQRAEAANRAKSDFLSTMSHDLRTPMNAIIGMASIAQMHTDEPERVADSLNKILLSGERLLGIINSVLDMSKIESGNVILEEKPLSLPVFLEEMAEMFKTQTREKNLKFRLQIDPMEHENVIGDEQRISRIVTNIMGNAIKYTQAGGTVSLHAEEKTSDVTGRGCYQLVFEDTGIGMEQSFVDQIFEPFSRAADSRTTATEGSGLGMSIALGLARMMGGDIRVESRPGVGSTFTVTLYLKINDSLDGAGQSRDAGDKKNIMLEDFAKADYTGKRALLVDDNELNIEVAQEILEMTGISVETAVNGQEAVDLITQKPEHYFDIVFMDIQMPVKNGYEATAAIRASGREDLKRIPIIAITADAFAEDIKKANQAGMNDHIAKPIDFAKLEIVLREWVQE
jgi:signal transduction histidine kinase/ActR/RegA family two-component response regulator